MINLSKISTLFHTVRYLKPIQIYYRFVLFITRNRYKKVEWSQNIDVKSTKLNFQNSIPYHESNFQNSFEFINLKKDFVYTIDWDYLGYGRLWTYNLNYFEFLDQLDSSPENGRRLIQDFIEKMPTLKVGFEPYPLSLRSINWIRFFIKNGSNQHFDSILYKQLELLTYRKEYHILANHLLENGFAFLFGAYYFSDEKFYTEAKKILIPQLREQILSDGGHFELSPMYHSTMLLRLLDSYNLISHNDLFDMELEPIIAENAQKMLTWLNQIVFSDGKIPLLNDSAFKIAPDPKKLNDYANRLGLKINLEINLGSSGYRKIKSEKFELVADIGAIGPNYQPGHAHADTFNFELYVNGRPVIVDTGTSTYEINDIRFYERSTAAHNTVVVNNENSSTVWSGHRVAQRATVSVIKDLPKLIVAEHNGFKKLKLNHKRTFRSENNQLIIIDELKNNAFSYLHFAPNEGIQVLDNKVVGVDFLIEFIGADSISVFDSHYSPEFNIRLNRKSLCISFKNKLEALFI